MDIGSKIKRDKIRAVLEAGKRRVYDFRIEIVSRLSRKTMIGIGSGLLALTLIGSTIALVGSGDSKGQSGEALAALEEQESLSVYQILVNDSPVVALATEEEAQSVLTGVAEYYLSDGAKLISQSFSETVEIVPGTTEEEIAILSVDEAVTMLVTGSKEPKTYTIESGDNLWDISMDCDMSVDELIAANPAIDPDHLKIGTTLNLYEVKPYLHLTLTEELTAVESIEYSIQYEDTSTLYKGEVQIKVAGVYGQREVKKENVLENGVLISSKELESTVVSEPQTQVMLKGTKSLSTLVGTGSFNNPMAYLEVSSPYGSRGGGRHTGVDFRNPKGTPIYVVDDGVVTFAAYQGTYGNLVKVSHGNGTETWYAHCDTIVVKIGDVVRKGDQIATVGDTGRATGYHLHFEVRKNGVPQNPMNYL